MKILSFVLFPVFLIFYGCAGNYTLTTQDIKGIVGGVVEGRTISVRGATLVVINNAPFDVVLDLKGNTIVAPFQEKVTLCYPLAGLMGDNAVLNIPVTAVALAKQPTGVIVGIKSAGWNWQVRGNSYSSNETLVLEFSRNQLYFKRSGYY